MGVYYDLLEGLYGARTTQRKRRKDCTIARRNVITETYECLSSRDFEMEGLGDLAFHKDLSAGSVGSESKGIIGNRVCLRAEAARESIRSG